LVLLAGWRGRQARMQQLGRLPHELPQPLRLVEVLLPVGVVLQRVCYGGRG